MFKLKPYREMLDMSKAEKREALTPVRVKRAEKQAELEILKMEEKMTNQEARINELCAKEEIDFNAIIEALDEFALMERRKEQLQTVIDEMFPDGE